MTVFLYSHLNQLLPNLLHKKTPLFQEAFVYLSPYQLKAEVLQGKRTQMYQIYISTSSEHDAVAQMDLID